MELLKYSKWERTICEAYAQLTLFDRSPKLHMYK